MSQLPESNFTQQTHSGAGDNVGRDKNDTSYFSEIGGDFKGIQGDISGGVINQYIITQKSGFEITSQRLITGSPYLGLRKFEVDDKDKFFGRDRWIIELTNYLAKENVLLLLGASGSGKSSLIQAGLIPKLKDQWGSQLFNFTFVPDVDPFESFYGCLLTKYKQSEAKLARTVKEDTLIQVVQTLKNDAQWLIFIDQFEEVFTRTPKTERDIFIKSLIQLIENSDNSVKVIMTMRADFLDKLSPYPDLGKVHDSSSRMLTDMEDSDLRLAIAEPAARNGVIFEQGLIDTIIADFKQQAGSLPLLQYTLNLLWSKDDITDRVLNTKAYQELGGVTGALQQQANKIYDQFDETQRKFAEEIFLELIELVGKEAVSRRADKGIFERDEMQKEVLYQLIDNRLLVSKGEDGKATVEVAHEELLRSWKMLRILIASKKKILIWRGQLYADAEQWYELRKQDSQKAKDELWSGLKLSRILGLIKRQLLPNLNPIAIQFVRNSWDHQNQLKAIEAERKQREVNTELGLANSLSGYSLHLFNEGKELDAFVEAIRAGRILQKYKASNTKVTDALHKILNEGREYNHLVGHNDSISSVSFSSDGKTLASGSWDNTVKLWNIEAGQEIRTLTGHNNRVNSVSFSSDGKTLASGSWDKTIKLWNTETGQEISSLTGHNSYVNSVSFSSDGKTLASGSLDNTIKLWNVETGQEICSLMGHNFGVNSVNFSSDGKTLASGSGDNTIKLWNIETGQEICSLIGHNFGVNSVNFSSDGKTLASGSSDNTIKLWNIETGQEISSLIGHNLGVNSVSFSSDGKTLASGSDDKTTKLWNVETGQEICSLTGHNSIVTSVSFSSDNKTFASGSWNNTIKLCNVETGKEIRTLTGHNSIVTSVSFSSDNKILATGSWDETIKLWNVETEKEIRTLTGHNYPVNSVSFSRDGSTLATSSDDETIKMWNVNTGKEICTFTGHNENVRSVIFRSDGKTLASSSNDNTVKLWNVQTGTEICTLIGHNEAVDSVSFSSDSKTLASGSSDNTIKLWNVETGTEICSLTGHNEAVSSVSFSSDGKTLASGSLDNTIKLWNVKTGTEIRTLTGHNGIVESVSFSSDGKTLATSSWDKTIKLWNVETGTEIRSLSGHNSGVWSVSFSSDGKTLASVGEDGTIKLWNGSNGWDLDALMGRSCDWVRAYLHNPNSDAREEDRHLCDEI
jgi:WD40 repeat protein/energy-coupling factor transporter ATP-binding protein EcfA2